MLGFGYDPTINDFKIVMFRSASPHDHSFGIARVMTLETNTWRTLDSNSLDLSRVESCQVGYSDSVAVAGSVCSGLSILIITLSMWY